MGFQPYVPPEQLIKDRSEYARKGIARGKSVVALGYADGILFLAENPSATLHKVSEIYDRIAFAGVGKYSEFEDLRIAGIRLADLRGYNYGREDVTAKTLANAYSQALSNIFTTQMKPYEVEILVVQVGERPADSSLFHILFDGSVADEERFVAMGGKSDDLSDRLKDSYLPEGSLADALRVAVEALSAVEERTFESERLEVAVLDRTRPRRKFRRLGVEEVTSALAAGS
ncbi:MAG TPA: proteasome subunit alpha [Actinomycetota bacterium]|nr:proteasome subunit alpha [Actinomycetota bacterium]